MAQINLNITLDITDDNAHNFDLLETLLRGRLEHIIGEEFGDPAITHRDQVNWAGDLYIEAETFPKVTDITFD